MSVRKPVCSGYKSLCWKVTMLHKLWTMKHCIFKPSTQYVLLSHAFLFADLFHRSDCNKKLQSMMDSCPLIGT